MFFCCTFRFSDFTAFQSQFVTGAGRAILIKKESLRKACALLEEREPDNMHLVTPSPTKNEEGYPQFVVTVKRVFNRVHYLESITGLETTWNFQNNIKIHDEQFCTYLRLSFTMTFKICMYFCMLVQDLLAPSHWMD